MADRILINISVHPYVRKYLLFHHPEPMSVTDRSYACSLICGLLQKPDKVDPKKVIKAEKLDLGAHYGILIGHFAMRKYGSHLTTGRVVKFNEGIDALIRTEMFNLVQSRKTHNAQEVDASIREFIGIYCFSEDELPFENLKRWYYREKARRKERSMQSFALPKPQYVLNF